MLKYKSVTEQLVKPWVNLEFGGYVWQFSLHQFIYLKCNYILFYCNRQSSTCISWEVVEATCACLLAQAEEAEKQDYSICLAEQMILEEFGRCLSQILHSEFKSKGLKVE